MKAAALMLDLAQVKHEKFVGRLKSITIDFASEE